MAMGGNMNPQVEVEKDEIIVNQTNSGELELNKIQGETHKNGGVTLSNNNDSLNLKKPFVVSNTLGVGGKSYAKIVEEAEKQGSKLRDPINDMFSKNRIKKVVDKVTAMNQAHIESLGLANGVQEMKYGGKIKAENGIELPEVEIVGEKYNPSLGQMSTMDYVTAGVGLAGTAFDIYQNRKIDEVKYPRLNRKPINMTPAIIDARDDANTGINAAAYDIRTNAPTAGSYLANRTALGIKGAKGIGKQTADLRFKEAMTNTEIANQDIAGNVEIGIKEMQDYAANKGQVLNNRSQIARNLYGQTAQFAKNTNQEDTNQTIAENIGTSQVKWINKKPYINVNGKWVPWV
jgi:hypothetical protein